MPAPFRFCLAAALLAAPPALAETDIPALIRDQGLRAAEAQLAALPEPTPTERFGLGGVRFLGGIERALQLRYATGLSGGITAAVNLPILRLPIPENPAPAPFESPMIADLFAAVSADMDAALDTLATIGDSDEVGLAIALGDLWFDINANGTRDPGEALHEVAATILDIPSDRAAGLVIRFDTADAAWLSAYAHLLAGISETVLALGPTEAIARTLAARDAMAALPQPLGSLRDWWNPRQLGTWADTGAIVIGTLEGRPDTVHLHAARDHFLAMIADNRVFWARVAQESDNEAEWIPNKSQTSALPLWFPPETGALWLDVLNDAEGLLEGRLLLPFWRLGPEAGINLARLLEDPPEIDVFGLIQGETLVPYMETGRRIDAEALRRFSDMLGGQAGLYMVILN